VTFLMPLASPARSDRESNVGALLTYAYSMQALGFT
jgi:hypothetical protein